MIIENVDEATVVLAGDSQEGTENMEVVTLTSQVSETTAVSETTVSEPAETDWSQIGVIAGVGYIIVFLVLTLLIVVFTNLPKLLNVQLRRKLKRAGKLTDNAVVVNVTGEVNAAIATALMIYLNEQHDEESNVITIKRVAKVYSPWSSKIYGLNNYFRSR